MTSKLDLRKSFNPLVTKAENLLIDQQKMREIFYDSYGKREMKDAAKKEQNKNILAEMSGDGANVYALWSRSQKSNQWELKYIGQRSRTGIKRRLHEHLFFKHEKTGSQLEKIKGELKMNKVIGITTIAIIPNELRSAVEESLIIKSEKGLRNGLWNVHGSKRRK